MIHDYPEDVEKASEIVALVIVIVFLIYAVSFKYFFKTENADKCLDTKQELTIEDCEKLNQTDTKKAPITNQITSGKNEISK